MDNQEYVYFLHGNETGLIKIGRSYDPMKRLNSMQLSEQACFLLSIEGDKDKEAELHQRFAAYRKYGEWFAPSPELLYFIEEHGIYDEIRMYADSIAWLIYKPISKLYEDRKQYVELIYDHMKAFYESKKMEKSYPSPAQRSTLCYSLYNLWAISVHHTGITDPCYLTTGNGQKLLKDIAEGLGLYVQRTSGLESFVNNPDELQQKAEFDKRYDKLRREDIRSALNPIPVDAPEV